MRKLALLLAAGLIVSAPLIAAAPTDTHAAAKKAAKKAPGGKGGKAEVSPEEANGRFARALGDLANALGTYVYVPGQPSSGGKGGKAGGKKSTKRG